MIAHNMNEIKNGGYPAKGASNPSTIPWQVYTLEPDLCYHTVIGSLHIWIKHVHHDWYVAHERALQESGSTKLNVSRDRKKQAHLSWNRWATGEGKSTVQLRPATPERPVVIRPEHLLKVAAGSKTLLFIALPVWVRIEVGLVNPVTLCELSTVVLSNTWFGDTTAGELCYALKTSTPGTLDEVQPMVHQAICPVSITNKSLDELDFQSFCVRTEHLSIYRGSSALWTNQVELELHGVGQVSRINFSKDLLQYKEVEEIIFQARKPVSKNLVKKSFHFLKDITGI